MESIVLGNRSLSYRSYGRHVDHNRPPLVLLHGAGGSHLIWPPQIRHLPNTAVYALDLPGHGASPPPVCATISAYSEVVRDFVDALELPWFVLGGHSMGGAIALDFALAYEHRLAGIVVAGAGARMKVAASLLDGIINDFMGTTTLIVESSCDATTSADVKEIYLRHLRDNDSITLYSDFVAVESYDIRDRIATVEVPTLVLCGRNDRMTPPALSSTLHERIQGSRLHIVEGAGHHVMLEKPDEVAQQIGYFLQTLTDSFLNA